MNGLQLTDQSIEADPSSEAPAILQSLIYRLLNSSHLDDPMTYFPARLEKENRR